MNNITRYASIGLTANKLKIIAILTMLIDHVAWVFLPIESDIAMLMHTVGRLTAPIMCFFIAEGYYHTSSLKKYITRLFLFSLISQIPYCLCFGHSFFEVINVMWPLTMGAVALAIYKKNMHVVPKWLLIIACFIATFNSDCGIFAVAWILCFGIFHGNRVYQIASFVIISVVFCIIPYTELYGSEYVFILGLFLFVPILFLYNGQLKEKSKLLKYSFYLFYPAHLILLYIINAFL